MRTSGILAVLLFLGTVGASAGDVYFDVTAAEARKIDMAVPMFFNESPSSESQELGQTIRDVLTQDLRNAGLFNVVDISSFFRSEGADRGDIDFKQWYLVGLQSLITGSYDVKGGDLTIRAWLYDIPLGQLIAGKAYTAEVAQTRQIVHRLADEIVYRFTGERGVAESKVFSIVMTGGTKQVCVMDADGNGKRVLTSGDELKLFPAPSPASGGSAGGKRVLYTSYRRANPDLYVLDTGSGHSTPLFEGGLNTTPDWSPDGSRIAWTRSVDGNPEIFVAQADGSKRSRLTFSQGVDQSPSWSPTGREIVFTSDRSGSPQLWIMDAEGGNQRRLTYTGDYNDEAVWSPRGDRIAFHSRWDGRFEIATIHPDGTGFLLITSGGGNNESPSWSPDGRRIAFASSRPGRYQLYVVAVEGGVPQRLSDGKDSYTAPSWVR